MWSTGKIKTFLRVDEGYMSRTGAQWQAAAFAQGRTPEGPDGVSAVLGARCRRFLEEGVPADWTGTWVMQDK